VFGLLVIRTFNLPHADDILTVSVLTVGFSIVAHGFTAVPYATWYASYLEKRSSGDSLKNQPCSSNNHRLNDR